ncbi:MAG: family 16 glycosylhydrolase [Prolixibacteraceae bacterium]|nr:family 16 glycosylhydrolase [Prolixibacteraceae bacterium]
MSYSSGSIESNRSFLYGKFEAKATYHYGGQFWPAFWLYGNGGGNAQVCEIDMLEVFSDDARYSVHYKDRIPGEWTLRPANYFPFFYETSYVYTMIWTPYKIEFYLNNILVNTVYHYNINGSNITNCSGNSATVANENNWLYPVPTNIILNFALNNVDCPGFPDPYLPNCFEVDYVKVWQRVPDFEISGAETLPFGNTSSKIFSVPFIEGASYSWSIPNGWSGNSSTNEITVHPNGANGGTITATLTFVDGQQISRSKEITVTNVPELSGPSLVCYSGSSFRVSNLPSGSTVSWKSSSNLTRVSSSYANPCVFRANSSGSGWVEASVSVSGGTPIPLGKKTVWVGSPKKPYNIYFYPYSPV